MSSNTSRSRRVPRLVWVIAALIGLIIGLEFTKPACACETRTIIVDGRILTCLVCPNVTSCN